MIHPSYVELMKVVNDEGEIGEEPLLVNSQYNIVDQIFIGWGVGYLGNGATNVVFPLTMIGLAFSLMFEDGASAYLSLKLGEKKKDEAEKV